MKACGGIQVHAFLTWALNGGEWSASQTKNSSQCLLSRLGGPRGWPGHF